MFTALLQCYFGEFEPIDPSHKYALGLYDIILRKFTRLCVSLSVYVTLEFITVIQ